MGTNGEAYHTATDVWMSEALPSDSLSHCCHTLKSFFSLICQEWVLLQPFHTQSHPSEWDCPPCLLSIGALEQATAEIPLLWKPFSDQVRHCSSEPSRAEDLTKQSPHLCLCLHLPHCTSLKWVLYQFPGCSATILWSEHLSLDLSQEPL